jgi:lipid-A-disaccharide synthase
MKYYIIAGEASGDLHGGNLVKAIKGLDQQADIRCWGGDKMAEAGAVVVKHIRELAFMGFVEVVANLRTIMANFARCKEDVAAFEPDVLILIDYPGFNLRMAAWAKARGIKVVYYISPQVWAWKEGRVKQIKASVDEMIVILPFEKDFYRKWDYEVDYVGHPLMDVVHAEMAKPLEAPISDKPIIALLPGSRQQEVVKKLPVMLSVMDRFPGYQFVVAEAPTLDASFYQTFLKDYPGVLSVRNRTYDLLRQSRAALVTSGTATLETALFKVPQVVCYMGNPISYWLAKRLIKVKYISLVNLIMDKPIVKELIQADLNKAQLVAELRPLLEEGAARTHMLADYDALHQLLDIGSASQNAARIIVDSMAK